MPTLLSSLEAFQKPDSVYAVHPFSKDAHSTFNVLHDLINTTEHISTALRLYYDASSSSSSASASASATGSGTGGWSNNPKLISLLRQHANIQHTASSVDRLTQHLVVSLKSRSDVVVQQYPETLPMHPQDVPGWCINQLVHWATSLGMETFHSEETKATSTVVMGGKVLVIDVDFATVHGEDNNDKLKVLNVKTSNALMATTTSGSDATSSLLDAFLLDAIRAYCVEMQKDEDARDSQRAAVLKRRVVEHLSYLVLLDELANQKDAGGIRWFKDLDDLYPVLIDLAKSEAQAVAVSLSSPLAPLDVFLLRCHSLPLPYLLIPSISFLIHISPSAYLRLSNKSSTSPTKTTTQSSLPIDISLSDIRNAMASTPEGVTIATLSLNEFPASGVPFYQHSMSMATVSSRPTFPFSLSTSEFDLVFPQIRNASEQKQYVWMLDFTYGGKRRGVVMSQSRMKAIELIVNPLAVGNNLGVIGETVVAGSWVDLLLKPANPIPSERYISLYTSPNGLHPPLQLRLAAPEEPGYVLDGVPIRNMKEIWGILEIVREQCWMNETLLGCDWLSEGMKMGDEEEDMSDSVPATEEGLEAVLSGTFAPRRIPVNVFIPSGNETEDLFGTDMAFLSGSRPKIVMTCPERGPISGVVEITVGYDEKKAYGVSVTMQGGFGLDVSPLEEVCRRGGTFGIAGRVWMQLR